MILIAPSPCRFAPFTLSLESFRENRAVLSIKAQKYCIEHSGFEAFGLSNISDRDDFRGRSCRTVLLRHLRRSYAGPNNASVLRPLLLQGNRADPPSRG
eukprot:g5066.t1